MFLVTGILISENCFGQKVKYETYHADDGLLLLFLLAHGTFILLQKIHISKVTI